MIRKKINLVNLIRKYSYAYHHALSQPGEETEEKFQKNLTELVDYIDTVVFLPDCENCFAAAHPERGRKK